MPASDVPDIEVMLNGADMLPGLYANLIDVEVQDDTAAPCACKLSFVAWDDLSINVARADLGLFDLETAIAIKLGYVTRLATVSKTEVVSVDLEMQNGQVPRVIVRGYDPGHRLRRGTRTRSFRNMKDSAIAEQVARDNGLSAAVVDSEVTHESVLQTAKSDFDFLRERAKDIGYEVSVDGTELRFRPVEQAGGPPPLPINAESDLTDLTAQLKAVDQVGSVEVRGWDPVSKKAIVGRAGRTSPDRAISKAKLVLFERAVTTQAQADRAATAAMENRARKGMLVQGSCLGRTDLRAGVEIDLQRASERFNGVYRLTLVTHRFSARAGFVTSFSGERKLT